MMTAVTTNTGVIKEQIPCDITRISWKNADKRLLCGGLNSLGEMRQHVWKAKNAQNIAKNWREMFLLLRTGIQRGLVSRCNQCLDTMRVAPQLKER